MGSTRPSWALYVPKFAVYLQDFEGGVRKLDSFASRSDAEHFMESVWAGTSIYGEAEMANIWLELSVD